LRVDCSKTRREDCDEQAQCKLVAIQETDGASFIYAPKMIGVINGSICSDGAEEIK